MTTTATQTSPTLHTVVCPELPKLGVDGQALPPSSHRMAYWQWGNALAPHVVVCVHGLSRQGRDFDVLAQAIVQSQPNVRVVCPDVVGRGQSDWLSDPMGYQVPNYAMDMVTLLHHLQPQTLDWVGTSMGGLIGTVVAAQVGDTAPMPLPVPVRKFVINDVGPVIQFEAIARIGTYVGMPARFNSLEQGAQALWMMSQSFGPHSPEQWLALSQHMLKPDGDAWVLHYDPAIAVPFRAVTAQAAAAGEAMLWQLYDQIQAQTLLLRGAQSDLLSSDTAHAMTQRGPRAQLREFAGVGHAPTLVAPDQVQAVLNFLF
jgi:pimeloyl-ACP methyl ester carboxylesterase